MTQRSWVVGWNESAILGNGWFSRCPDWFGLPFRESAPSAVLRFPTLASGDRLTLFVASDLAIHRETQFVRLRTETQTWDHVLKKAPMDLGWQSLTLEIERDSTGALEIAAESWRHGDYEPVEDFRPAGLIFGAAFLKK